MDNKHIIRLREITIEPTPDRFDPPREIPHPLTTAERVWAEVKPGAIRAILLLVTVYTIIGLISLFASPGVKERAAKRAAVSEAVDARR